VVVPENARFFSGEDLPGQWLRLVLKPAAPVRNGQVRSGTIWDDLLAGRRMVGLFSDLLHETLHQPDPSRGE